MPKYRILCYSTIPYWLDVEAPSKEAVEKYYDGCDGTEFIHGCADGWEFSDIMEDSALEPAICVDENGEVIDA